MNGLINLLPWRAQRLKKRILFWAIMFAVGIFSIALAYGGWRWHIEQQIMQVRLAAPTSAQLETLRRNNARQWKHRQELATLHQQRQATIQHQQRLQRWQPRLEQLAAQLPDAVWFDALRFDSGRLEITGKSLTEKALNQWASLVQTLPGVDALHQGATAHNTDAAWHFNWTLVMESDDAPTH